MSTVDSTTVWCCVITTDRMVLLTDEVQEGDGTCEFEMPSTYHRVKLGYALAHLHVITIVLQFLLVLDHPGRITLCRAG